MTETKEKLVELEQRNIEGKPFKFLSDKAFETWRTDYQYWMDKKSSPLLGRWEKGKFEIWKKGEGFVEADYNSYYYDAKDPKTGEVKRKNYFRKKFARLVEFKTPEKFPDTYNPQTKKKEDLELTKISFLVSPGMNETIDKYMEAEARRPGNKPYDNYYVVESNGEEGLSKRYTFAYHSEGEHTEVADTNKKPNLSVKKEESFLDKEYVDSEDPEGEAFALRSIIASIRENGFNNEEAADVLVKRFGVDKEVADKALSELA